MSLESALVVLIPEAEDLVGTFRRLTEITADRFPETPAYGGESTDIIPHLTVAQVGDPHYRSRKTTTRQVTSAGFTVEADEGSVFNYTIRFKKA